MRTSRQSLDYWQHDVGMYDDAKLVDLSEKYGPLGEAIFLRVLTEIAKTEGYFASFNEQLILSVYRSIGSKWIKNRAVVAEVIHYCGVCGLFDVNLLAQNVLTSRGIQRRWLYAKKRSRAKGYSTSKFWLLDQSDEENEQDSPISYNNERNVRNKADKCSNNADKCSNNAPIEVKGSKINNEGGELLSSADYNELVQRIGKDDTRYYLERVKAFRARKPEAKFDVKTTVLKWYREDEKRRRLPSGDKTYTSEELNAAFDGLGWDDL